MKIGVLLALLIVVGVLGCSVNFSTSQPQVGQTDQKNDRGAFQIGESNNPRVETIKANPKYGDIIVVTIQGGVIGIGERYAYQPVQFELARGEYKGINFRRQDKPTAFRTITMLLSTDGDMFYFDPGMFSLDIPNNGKWNIGATYYPKEIKDISVGSGAKNLEITIRYKFLPR
jgi:hypothetical protein